MTFAATTGMALMVRCADAVPQITLADLLFRTQTAAGTGGSTIAGYTTNYTNTLTYTVVAQ